MELARNWIAIGAIVVSLGLGIFANMGVTEDKLLKQVSDLDTEYHSRIVKLESEHKVDVTELRKKHDADAVEFRNSIDSKFNRIDGKLDNLIRRK